MRYRDFGGSGTPVLLIPSPGFSSAMFDELAANLAPRHVVALDLRGSGQSDFPTEGYDYDTLALDIVGLLDHLGWEKAALGGSSTGSWVALHTAARYPQRVERLMLLDGGFVNHSAIPGSSFERFAKPVEIPESAYESPTAMFDFLQGLAGDRAITTDAFRTAVFDTFVLDDAGHVVNSDPEFVVQQAWSKLLWDSRIEGALASVRCPALILVATRGTGIKPIDAWWQKSAKDATKRLSRAKLAKIDGTHLLVFDALPETVQLLASFLPE